MCVINGEYHPMMRFWGMAHPEGRDPYFLHVGYMNGDKVL